MTRSPLTLHSWWVVVALFVSGLMAHPAQAKVEKRRLAIIELDTESDNYGVDELSYLNEAMISVASSVLRGQPYIVMDRETIGTLMPQDELAECLSEDCLLTLGAQLQSQFVMGGTLRRVQGKLGVAISLYDVQEGANLGTQTRLVETDDFTVIVELAETFTAELLAALPRVGPTPNAPTLSKPTLSGPAPPTHGPSTWSPVVSGGQILDSTGRLLVEGKPKGAWVEVMGPDGYDYAGPLPTPLLPSLKPGKYKVSAMQTGYLLHAEIVDVRVDETTVVNIQLDELASVEVNGHPENLSVKITGPDGLSHVSGVPATLESIPPGSYSFMAASPGYETQTRNLTLSPGQQARLNIELEPLGSLVVSGSPQGAEVHITGPNGFSTTQGLPVTINSTWSGWYEVRVQRPGYLPFESTSQVRPGEETKVYVTLVKGESRAKQPPAKAKEPGVRLPSNGMPTAGRPPSGSSKRSKSKLETDWVGMFRLGVAVRQVTDSNLYLTPDTTAGEDPDADEVRAAALASHFTDLMVPMSDLVRSTSGQDFAMGLDVNIKYVRLGFGVHIGAINGYSGSYPTSNGSVDVSNPHIGEFDLILGPSYAVGPASFWAGFRGTGLWIFADGQAYDPDTDVYGEFDLEGGGFGAGAAGGVTFQYKDFMVDLRGFKTFSPSFNSSGFIASVGITAGLIAAMAD